MPKQGKGASTFFFSPDLFPLVPGVHGAVAGGGFELQVPQAHWRCKKHADPAARLGRQQQRRGAGGKEGGGGAGGRSAAAAVCTSTSFSLPSPHSARQLGHASL